MIILKRIVKQLFGNFLKIKARDKIARLCNSDGVLRLIGKALRETLDNEVTADEKIWIDRIEMLRKDLNCSEKKISVIDYGAGESNLCLTEKEMLKGREVDRIIGEVCKSASKPYLFSLFLFKLIREFKPTHCLELGTCLGISACFQAAALKLNGGGELITLEGSETLASLAEGHFDSLSIDNVNVVTGRFHDTLSEVLSGNKSVDYAFIDGHHDEKATIEYFEQILPFLSEGALLVFDDISWSDGMKRAWMTIIADNRIKISVDLRVLGVCIIDRRIDYKKNILMPL